MKKIISILLIFCFLPFFAYAEEVPEINSLAAVLINAETGEILYSKNHDEKLPMASTTKIMTALLTLEEENLDEKFTVNPDAIRVEGTSMGLREGDKISLYELSVGMLLSSGNDAARAAAFKISGSEEAFLQKMNERASLLGLKNTNFETATGLDKEGHGSSALDMALLGAHALENELFKNLTSQKSVSVCFGNPEIKRTLYNHNKLLLLDDDIIGVKTGYTKKAGRCLVSAKEKDGVRLVAVTLKASDDFNTHLKLFDYGFSKVKETSFKEESFSLPLVGGDKETISLSASQKTVFHTGEIETRIYLPKFIYAGVKKGDVLGEKKFFSCGKEIDSVPIVASEDADIFKKKNFFDRIWDFFKKIF